LKVYEYIEFLVNGEISNLAVADVGDMTPGVATPTALQTSNRDKLRSFINLANIELHKKFNIIQKDMELDFALHGEEFKLDDDFLHAISCVFTKDGVEIPINNDKTNFVDGIDNNVSVMFKEPAKALIKGTDVDGKKDMILTYAASPKLAKTILINLQLPQIYTEALLNYVAYKAHAAISGDIKAENNTYYLRFNESVKQINLLGLFNPDNLDANTKLTDRGFV
jgi:hypothetical protein